MEVYTTGSKHESVNDIGNITSDMIKAASNIKWI